MAKLSAIYLAAPLLAESDDRMLSGKVIIAGKGRLREQNGRVVLVPDIELEDDVTGRRVFVRIVLRTCESVHQIEDPDGKTPPQWVVVKEERTQLPDKLVPYERLHYGDVVPELKAVAPVAKVNRK